MAVKQQTQQIYQQIIAVTGKAASEFTAADIAPYIPEGADPRFWLKILRNHAIDLQNPPKAKKVKRARPSRSTYGYPRRGVNYAAQLVKREAEDYAV